MSDKNRMSNELQAIMQMRLAKSAEAPADEQMQDDNIKNSDDSNQDSMQEHGDKTDHGGKMNTIQSQQKQRNKPSSVSTTTTAATGSNVANAAKKFQSMSLSPSSQSSLSIHPAGSSFSYASSSIGSSKNIHSNVGSARFLSSPKENNKKVSSPYDGSTISTPSGSVFHFKRINSQRSDDNSPFDERSPRNVLKQNRESKTITNLKKDSFQRKNGEKDYNGMTNIGNDNGGDSNSSVGTGTLLNHPYVQRYSPTDFSNRESHEGPPQSKSLDTNVIDNNNGNSSNRFSPTFSPTSLQNNQTSFIERKPSIDSVTVDKYLPNGGNRKAGNDSPNHGMTRLSSANLKSIEPTGLPKSHVSAMKKMLFTKTNPSPPPLPPTHNSSSFSPTFAKKKGIEVIGQALMQDSSRSITSIKPSLSSLSKDCVEITIDNFESTIKEDVDKVKDSDSIVEIDKTEEEEHDKQQMTLVDSSKSTSGDSSETLSDWKKLPTEKLDKEEQLQVETNVFDSNKDWDGIPQSTHLPVEKLDKKEQLKLGKNIFDSNQEWADAPQSTTGHQDSASAVPAFDQLFLSTEKNNWDWPSSSNNEKKQEDSAEKDNNPFSSASFFELEKFSLAKEDEKGYDELIIEDEFENEPEMVLHMQDDPIVLNSTPFLKNLNSNNIGAVKNPLTKNLIICHKRSDNQWYIEEVGSTKGSIISSTQISTNMIRHKISASTSLSDAVSNLKTHIICDIEQVEQIAVGLHRQHNRTRVRVAAIVKIKILGNDGVRDTVNIVVIWQWGYATSGSTIVLQNIISTPPPELFQAKSLCIADGLVFLASKELPVIFIAKPHVRDAWSTNNMTNGVDTKNNIVSISVTPYLHREFKLLALGFSDGSVSLWTYEKAVLTNRSALHKNQLRARSNQLLQLFCELEALVQFKGMKQDISLANNDMTELLDEENDESPCCSIEWFDSYNNTSSSTLLATAFPNAIAIYIVPMRKNTDIIIKPITVATVNRMYTSCKVAWILTSQCLPCLSMLFSNPRKSYMLYGSIGLPIHTNSDENNMEIQFNVFCADELPITCNQSHWSKVNNYGTMTNVVSCGNGDIVKITPVSRFQSEHRESRMHPALPMLFQPVVSNALGIGSTDIVHSRQLVDNFFHVHSHLCWNEISSTENNSMLYQIPILRQWLCLTRIGDRKKERTKNHIEKEGSFPTSGAQMTPLVELECKYTPHRIVGGSSKCAVLFVSSPGLPSPDAHLNNHQDPKCFSIYQIGSEKADVKTVFNCHPGRDVIFVESLETKTIFLDQDGVHLEVLAFPEEHTSVAGPKTRIFRKGSAYDEKLYIHRVFLLRSREFLFLASRKEDSRQLLLYGGDLEMLTISSECLIDGKKSKFWFSEGERILSVVELPPMETSTNKCNIAIATSSRILIVGCEISLNILAECQQPSLWSGLVPLGSYCVSFISHEGGRSQVKYLSCLNGDDRTHVGTITNLPVNNSCLANVLVGLRPDRVVYNSIFTGCDNHESISLKIPLTKPVFLLEPLIASVLCEPNSEVKEKSLVSLLERFGVKRGSNPHNENEGIGTKGIGLTSLVFQMLNKHGHENLITKISDKRNDLMPWIPICDKKHNREKQLGTKQLGTNIQSQNTTNDNIYNIVSQYCNRTLHPSATGNAIRALNLLGNTNSRNDSVSTFLAAQKDGSQHQTNNRIVTEPKKNITEATFDDRKHFWHRGPFNKKEELLLLNSIEEWVGKCRPSILGKEGAELAAESGQVTLQSILAQAEKGISKDENDDVESSQCSSFEAWVDNVGQGQTDEEKLTLYLRFFEGSDEDSEWRNNCLSDLSSFQNKPKLIESENFGIEATTSNVDEGESGTVRLLHDLVFNRDIQDDEICGLFVEVKRGSSLDIGMFHTGINTSRQRKTLEFWYFLPKCSKEIILARRSVCFQNGEDIESLCCKAEKESILWELVVLPTGRLEFRCCGGGKMDTANFKSTQQNQHGEQNVDSDTDDEPVDAGLVSLPREDGYGGWNHVCLSFSSKDLSMNECNVAISMKGIEINSSIFEMQLPSPGLEQGETLEIDDCLSISALMFGIGATAGFRLTELRVWAYQRPLADIKSMMYEYLDVAKIKKKKFKLAIRGKEKQKKAGVLAPEKPKRLDGPESDRTRSRRLEVQNTAGTTVAFDTQESFANFDVSFNDASSGPTLNDGRLVRESSNPIPQDSVKLMDESNAQTIDTCMKDTDEVPYKIIESCLLSEDVRKSAAAAIIRGAPATKHFGGNRGGLVGNQIGIGSISICGAQKTVILSHGQEPRGKTYPIGASGAIISDLVEFGEEADKQEFLCCFLAKDRRMVVFELKSKKVVVELQMTTKLNFWRFLPAPVHGDNNVVFLLVTPIGGFHWLPLANSPRPRQVWKRGDELQSKKIISYEEGGSNGLEGEKCRSMMALLSTVISTEGGPMEAWCLRMNTDTKPLSVSSDAVGAALMSTTTMLSSNKIFYPLLVLVTSEASGLAIEIFEFVDDQLNKRAFTGKEKWKFDNEDKIHECPAMAMGPSPPVICLCWKSYVVIIVRVRGLLLYYKLTENELKLVMKHDFRRYVVDAGIQSRDGNGGVEVAALVCEEDKKDGRIVTLHLK